MANLNRVNIAIVPRVGLERDLYSEASISGNPFQPFEVFYATDTKKFFIHNGEDRYIFDALTVLRSDSDIMALARAS